MPRSPRRSHFELPSHALRLTVAICAIAASLSGSASAQPTSAAAPQAVAVTPQTFIAVADTFVDASRANQNFGSNLKLRTDNSPVLRSFLRFNVTSLSGSVSKATLRVYATGSGSRTQVIEAHAVANSTWSESGITNATAPAVGSVIASAAKISSDTWVTYDVTTAVQGTGLVSFALTTTSSQNVPWSSREGSNPPELVVESGGSGAPPTNTAVPTITGTPQVGQTLTSSDGAWSGSTPMTYTRQWRRCDANGATCGDINGATNQTYTATTNDAGLRIRVAVKASNGFGNSTATSATTSVIQPVSGGGGSACGTRTTPPARYAHVIWIVMENKKYANIVGNSNAPYINDLANSCGLATNYFAITHPSLPNYIAATSGDTWGITNDGLPPAHPLAVPSIFSQVKAAGMTWRSYQEDSPGNCTATDTALYAPKHDPAVYYTGIHSDCVNWDVPMGTTTSGAFISALNSGTLPAFSLVTPNRCNDMHDCSIATGDAWLLKWGPKILASSAYQAGNTALMIFWDEAGGAGANQVAMLVVSPTTRAGTKSNTSFTHYSLLKTTEQLLGISTYLEHAGDAGTQSMRADFNF